MRNRKQWTRWCLGGIALATGMTCAHWAIGNGGPFVIKYPGGDPAAKGVLARLDPDLKPAREERLRVLKEDLKIEFLQDPMSELNRNSAVKGKVSSSLPKWLESQPPLASVAAIYTIENPTDQSIEVEFGFPVLRGIYVSPWSMMPRPDVTVKVDTQQIRPDIISNSMIYGLIRRRAQEVIDKALAGDAELSRLVENVRQTSYDRKRTGDAGETGRPGGPGITRGAGQGGWVAVPVDASDPHRAAARDALMKHLRDRMKWTREPASLMVEYASLELGQPASHPMDAGHGFYWGDAGDLRALAYANLGRLAAIGEQKATQLFAELASRFDPSVRTAYENIFSAWGGDVRERSVDLQSGKVRPRELTLSSSLSPEEMAHTGLADPTIYARLDYINPNAGLSDAEKASCETLLKNLPVTFTFAPMNLLHYKTSFPARSIRTLTVSYKQYAYADTREPASYQLAYVVHPASLWKEFGPIQLEVAVPQGLTLSASVPCFQTGVQERELPNPLARQGKAKSKVVIHRGTVADKTGELFVAVDADGWKRLTAPKDAVAAR